MGWWNLRATPHVIGDIPLDILGAAVARVIAEYQTAFNRRPSRAEWEALLLAVLGAEESEARAFDEGVATKVTLETS